MALPVHGGAGDTLKVNPAYSSNNYSKALKPRPRVALVFLYVRETRAASSLVHGRLRPASGAHTSIWLVLVETGAVGWWLVRWIFMAPVCSVRQASPCHCLWLTGSLDQNVGCGDAMLVISFTGRQHIAQMCRAAYRTQCDIWDNTEFCAYLRAVRNWRIDERRIWGFLCFCGVGDDWTVDVKPLLRQRLCQTSGLNWVLLQVVWVRLQLQWENLTNRLCIRLNSSETIWGYIRTRPSSHRSVTTTRAQAGNSPRRETQEPCPTQPTGAARLIYKTANPWRSVTDKQRLL